MRFFKLELNDKEITNENKIIEKLKELEFYWVLEAEVKSAKIEIKNDTIIWKGGKWLYGDWVYGIFLQGEFYGNWINGIFVDGIFKGEFNSGINFSEKEFG